MPWDHDTARSYGDIGPQHHLRVLGAEVPQLLGDLRGARVLDFGCGPGRLTLVLAASGAASVVAVDENPEMVARATEELARQERDIRDRVLIRHGNEAGVAELGPFDAVLSSLALMMADSRRRLHEIASALVGALRPDGRLLVIVTHPCFRNADYGTFHYRLPDDYDYWQSGVPYDVVLTPDSSSETPIITDHHWLLQDYCEALAEAGAVISRLGELPATRDEDGGPHGPPAYLALLAKRWPTAETAG